MKKEFVIGICYVFAVLFMISPVAVFAQTGATGTNPPATQTGAQNINVVASIKNPLNPKYSTIPLIVGGLLTAVEYVGGIACALYIIWAGFLFVEAQGNPEKLEKAKKTITYALIGTGIILGAGVILTIVQNTINAIKS